MTDPAAPLTDATLDGLLYTLWSGTPAPDVYAILDCARDPMIHGWIHRRALDYTCLYRGPIAPELERAAPYLVHLYPRERFTRELFTLGWGKSWGIFVVGNEPMEALRLHFRRFLRVQDEHGKRLIFRYYDPRVLRAYLPTCNADELKYIFGRAAALCAESADGTTLLKYRNIGGQLDTEPVELATIEVPEAG